MRHRLTRNLRVEWPVAMPTRLAVAYDRQPEEVIAVLRVQCTMARSTFDPLEAIGGTRTGNARLHDRILADY